MPPPKIEFNPNTSEKFFTQVQAISAKYQTDIKNIKEKGSKNDLFVALMNYFIEICSTITRKGGVWRVFYIYTFILTVMRKIGFWPLLCFGLVAAAISWMLPSGR